MRQAYFVQGSANIAQADIPDKACVQTSRFAVPDDLGGLHTLVLKDGDQELARAYFTIETSIASMTPSAGPAGTPGVHLIDLYPGIYQGPADAQQLYRLPQLTYLETILGTDCRGSDSPSPSHHQLRRHAAASLGGDPGHHSWPLHQGRPGCGCGAACQHVQDSNVGDGHHPVDRYATWLPELVIGR